MKFFVVAAVLIIALYTISIRPVTAKVAGQLECHHTEMTQLGR